MLNHATDTVSGSISKTEHPGELDLSDSAFGVFAAWG